MASRPDLSRRQFLARSAGLAGASLGLGGAVCGPEVSGATPGREVRLGFLGVGDRGTQLLAAALRIPGARIAAIADVDPARLRRAADLAREHRPRLASPEALLSVEETEAIFIASPVYLHREQAVAALRAGKHVYLEKPLALTPGDCRAVLDEAEAGERRGQVFQIGFQRRYNPRYLASLAAIERGDAGKILFVKAQWHSTGSPAKASKPWYFRREKSGDIVLEQACHQMDVFNWVFGREPLRACGMGGAHLGAGLPRADILDHYGLVLEYPGGGKVHHSHLSYAIPDRRFAGVYELVFGEKLGIDLANAIAWDRSGKTMELASQGGNDTQFALESFLNSIRTGQRPAADVRVAYRATLASLLALKALDSGQTAAWKDLV